MCKHGVKRLEGTTGSMYRFRCLECGEFINEPKKDDIENAYLMNEIFDLKKDLEKEKNKPLIQRILRR